ncbi:hypothetical protein EDD11_005256 [Mortierella claussenii]|nr:hypothetical protein EDD11_005256 [Mortierella claussenii]
MHNWNHQEETQDELETPSMHQQKLTPTRSTSSSSTPYLSESMVSSSSSSSPSTSNDKSSFKTPRTARVRPKVCTSDRDWADVQAVCQQLGIPARRLDFSRQYWTQVFEVMLHEYENGRTPNPDVACNREIKFGELIEWCQKNGGLGKDRWRDSSSCGSDSNNSSRCMGSSLEQQSGENGWDYLATGHYARVERDPTTGKARLLRALDSKKDQTYYLSTLSESVLRHALFPLAQFDKPTVKRMALTFGETYSQLKTAAEKNESMGICFVGQRRRFGEFLEEYLDTKPGPVRVNDLGGTLIGEHKGLFRYTVGQASGVTYKSQKWVVLKLDLKSNTLVVVDGTQNQRLFSTELIAESWHWIAGEPPQKLLEFLARRARAGENVDQEELFPFTAQIRHRQVPQPCVIEPVLDRAAGATDETFAQLFRVRFKDPQRAIAPGQQLVLYDQDECLGGAVIRSSLPPSIVAES